jgi:hypothetical protein
MPRTGSTIPSPNPIPNRGPIRSSPNHRPIPNPNRLPSLPASPRRATQHCRRQNRRG